MRAYETQREYADGCYRKMLAAEAQVVRLTEALEAAVARAVRAEAVVEAARDDPNQRVIAALVALDAVASSWKGATEFSWLIERGQPEGQSPPVWLDVYSTDSRTASYGDWVTDANEATKFPDRAEAEKFIRDCLTHPIRGASARAVEHGFVSAVASSGKGGE